MEPAFVGASAAQVYARPTFTGKALCGHVAAPASVRPARAAFVMSAAGMATPSSGSFGEGVAVADDDDDDVDEDVVTVCAPPAWFVNANNINAARELVKLHETDSGSPEFQIATLTTKITYLTNHLKSHSKDFSSTRGLLKMVATRRRLLKYLKSQDPKRFEDIISTLKIRVSQQLRQL